MGRLKTSLGIWAFGSMVTRFMPVGYQPALTNATTAEKVHRAVTGLGDLIDDYEFHYPAELNLDNLDEVRSALDGHGIYTLCAGLHLDPRFGKGGFSSPDDPLREEALQLTREAIDVAAEVGAHMVCWPGIEGYNYPFQTPYAQSWEWFVEGIAEAGHGAVHLLRHRLLTALRLVTAGDETGDHRAERPDAEGGPHVVTGPRAPGAGVRRCRA